MKITRFAIYSVGVALLLTGLAACGPVGVTTSMPVGAKASAPQSARLSSDEAWLKIDSGALLVDVRSADEFNAGHLQGALNIPQAEIQSHLENFGQNKDREIVLYCGSGRRAGLAEAELREHGFNNVYNAGGYKDLKEAHAIE